MTNRQLPETDMMRIVGKGPREIIARAVGGGPAYYSLADLILDRLRAAGYQIVKTYEASQNEMMDEEANQCDA